MLVGCPFWEFCRFLGYLFRELRLVFCGPPGLVNVGLGVVVDCSVAWPFRVFPVGFEVDYGRFSSDGLVGSLWAFSCDGGLRACKVGGYCADEERRGVVTAVVEL